MEFSKFLDSQVFERLENLEKLVNRLQYQIHTVNGKVNLKKSDEIYERLEKLESHYYSDGDLSAIHGQLDNIHKNDEYEDHRMTQIEDRLKELERFQEITHLEYQATKSKKPHKCPVCDGMGGFLSTEPNVCHACEGKGIVWG